MAKYVVELSVCLKCRRYIEAETENEALRLVGEALADDDFNIGMFTEMVDGDYEQFADHNVDAKVIGTTDADWVDWPCT